MKKAPRPNYWNSIPVAAPSTKTLKSFRSVNRSLPNRWLFSAESERNWRRFSNTRMRIVKLHNGGGIPGRNQGGLVAGTVALGSTGRKRQNIPHGPYRQTDISRKCRDFRESENGRRGQSPRENSRRMACSRPSGVPPRASSFSASSGGCSNLLTIRPMVASMASR